MISTRRRPSSFDEEETVEDNFDEEETVEEDFDEDETVGDHFDEEETIEDDFDEKTVEKDFDEEETVEDDFDKETIEDDFDEETVEKDLDKEETVEFRRGGKVAEDSALGVTIDTDQLSDYEVMIASHLVNPSDINVSWDNIAGLESFIQELKKSVVLPIQRKDLFEDSQLTQAPKGVLLHGPPGCGKTMIAKATAEETNTRFINLDVSILPDKWYGESQKLTAAVFSLAVKLQPCIIFIDKIVLTTLLGLRLRHLNSIVDETRVTKVRERGAPRESYDPASPEYFRELYTSLYATGERLNDHYSDRLFLWSAQTMILFLLEIYCLLTEQVSTLFVAATTVRLLSVVMGLLLYCTACQFTVGQATKIISALVEKNIRHTARINRGRREIFTMSLYMALRPFKFSALGFFSVDFSLTYAIITTTVTYVILCIQTNVF